MPLIVKWLRCGGKAKLAPNRWGRPKRQDAPGTELGSWPDIGHSATTAADLARPLRCAPVRMAKPGWSGV